MTAVALFIASGRWGSFFIATCVLQAIVYLTVLILSAGSSRYRFPYPFHVRGAGSLLSRGH